VITGAYREFFIAAAGATGALIGLLFVAVSVAPQRAVEEKTRLDFGSRASAALLLFTNVLTLSLVALVPNVTIGWWALAFAVGIFAFAAATARLIFDAGLSGRHREQSLTLVFALIGIAALETYGGIEQLGDTHGTRGLTTLDYLLIAELLVGIARAWQLIGLRDTGFVSSLRTLAHGQDEPKRDGEEASR
jgi:hypothetical protein